MPYCPSSDFAKVEGTDLSTGLVIEDGAQNQYVWIEVPRTAKVYPKAGINITEAEDGSFKDEQYTTIETDLHTYTTTYRNGTSYTDEHYSDTQTGLTETQYNDLKKTMLKSVYENGGFWIGRYETGIEDSYRDYGSDNTTEHPINETPVIKANAYPYNWVGCSQAQTLASRFSGSGYTSSLMFGVQWDLVLKYLETKAVEKGAEIATIQSELNSSSTSWGNCHNNTYNITNTFAKYSSDAGSTWTNEPYKKESSGAILLTTGASDTFSKQNIYDLAGNVWERTLEYTSNTSYPCATRGGDFSSYGSGHPASYRGNSSTTYSSSIGRFPCCTL